MYTSAIFATLLGALALTTASPTARAPENAVLEASFLDANATGVNLTSGTLDWDWAPITFDDVPKVNGWAHLTFASDGTYTFSGHFHVDGLWSYDIALVWAVKDSEGIMYAFTDAGRLHGGLEPGSRDHDWVKTGTSEEIARRWPQIEAGWAYSAQANVNFSVESLIDSAKFALGVVGAVIAVV